MSVVEQSKVVAEVERHGRGKNRRLRELGISRSTYYPEFSRRHRMATTNEVAPRRKIFATKLLGRVRDCIVTDRRGNDSTDVD